MAFSYLSLVCFAATTIAGLLIRKTVHYVHNGYCVIGVSSPSSIFLFSYDISINLFLTSMFVVPLIRATIRSAWLKSVAIRSSIASLIALITTAVNGIMVYVLDGNETIWICFGGCAADITIGTVVLYWALQGPEETSNSGPDAIYLSPIGGVSTFQTNPPESIIRNQDRSMVSDTSETTVAASHRYIPSLEKPEAAIQKSQQQAIFARDPSQKRLSLPLRAETCLGPRNVSEPPHSA
ncbi:unnamed protein product [Rhizoctonia solani]|uniref:Transmembrane protein n=1 Tax=Rhizoctonia solani TaxID=456999 RepID=A0A8H3HAQ8_9AGAM|nr:unnamed protein product [Rhizoctonia solani]